MSSLLDRMKSAGTIKMSSVLSKSEFFTEKDQVQTPYPILNIALSGKVDGGLTSGLTILAGMSKHYKSLAGLVLVQSYMKKYKDAVCLFYDSEFGVTPEYIESNGIDTNRVIHIPIEHIEQLKFDISRRLDEIKRGDKVIIFIDSVGNLASKKESEDALEGKSVADMSRAKTLKSLFRIITPHLTTKDIPCVAVNHIYMSQETYSRAIMSGGCLVAGTKIRTNGKPTPIEEIKVGDYVDTLSGLKQVIHVWNPDTLENGTPECLEIEFKDGYKVVCSENHPFMIDNKWVEAKNLSPGKFVRNFNLYERTSEITFIRPVGKKSVYDISVEDVQHYVLENGVVTHNTGPMYSSDTVIIFGKSQEKDGTELMGWTFTMNIEKSRRVKEKSKLPFTVMYEGGIQKWSGMLEIAQDLGFVKKPSNGWYSRVDIETGEIEDKKFREKDTHTDSFWVPIINNDKFKRAVERKYMLGQSSIMSDASIDEQLEDV